MRTANRGTATIVTVPLSFTDNRRDRIHNHRNPIGWHRHTARCRKFLRRGKRPAPFLAHNHNLDERRSLPPF
jgi:hypothetical protein